MTLSEIRLSVNVDHIATLREARKTYEPSPLQAAFVARTAGADGITVHIRKDRRHIKEKDAVLIRELVPVPLTVEMGFFEDILNFVLELKPDKVTLVPERPEEVTTEGGIDLTKDENLRNVKIFYEKLKDVGVKVGAFVDPVQDIVKLAKGLDFVEINTTRYAMFPDDKRILEAVESSAKLASDLGLYVMAGHALNLNNVGRIAQILEISELSIGHSIVSRAVFVGFERAVSEMKETMIKYRLLRILTRE